MSRLTIPWSEASDWSARMTATRVTMAALAATLLIGACSDDGGTDDGSSTSAVETTVTSEPTTTTTGPPPEPPAAGQPGTATIVFDDGETGTVDVSCQLEPVGEFAAVADSNADSTPFFGVTLWTDTDRTPDAVWQTEDDAWLAGGQAGTELEVSVDGSMITGTAMYKTTTGQDRAGAFTVACPG